MAVISSHAPGYGVAEIISRPRIDARGSEADAVGLVDPFGAFADPV
jgi:hypothetical protein